MSAFSGRPFTMNTAPHVHVLMRSWRKGQTYIALRCATCPHVEYEPHPDPAVFIKGPFSREFWERAYGPPEFHQW